MTNVAPNSSSEEPIENGTNKKLQPKNTIQSLLNDTIIAQFGEIGMSNNSFQSPVNPAEYDKYRANPDNYVKKVRNEMIFIRNADTKNSYGEILNSDIQSISTASIKKSILSHTADFASYRSKVIQRAKQIQPDLNNNGESLEKFLQYIHSINQDKLHSLTLSPVKLKHLIHEKCPELLAENEKDTLNTLFPDRNEVGCTSSELSILVRMARDVEKGLSPKESDIEMVLRLYKSKNQERKKKLLNDLGANFSLHFALDHGWITEDQVDSFIDSTFPELQITTLSEDEKKELRIIVLRDSKISITANDISNDSILNTLFEKETRKEIAQTIAKEWSSGPNVDMNAEDEKYSQYTKKINERFNYEFSEKGRTDYTFHDAFIDIMKETLTEKGKEAVEGIEKFKDGSILQYTGPDKKPRYLRLKKTTGDDGTPLDVLNGNAVGVMLADITGKDGSIASEKPMEFSYDQLANIFLQGIESGTVFSSEEFASQTTKNPSEVANGEILDMSDADENIPVNASNILLKLNELDPEGSKYGFEEGTYFLSDAEESSKDGKKTQLNGVVWKIGKINTSNNTLDLVFRNGTVDTGIPIQAFYATVKQQSFKRLSNIKNDDDFVKQLVGNSDLGLYQNTELHDGHLSFEEEDEKKKKHKYTIHNFIGSGDEHIRMGAIKNGLVTFGEYDGTDVTKAKKIVEKKGEKAAEKFYTWRTMTYGAFLKYLAENKLKASKEDKIVEHAHHKHEHDEHNGPHMHGSFWSKVFNTYNLHDLFKAGELLTHSIEHALEKGSKANAAKAALNMGRFLHLPAGIQAQLTADIVDGNKELIEKYTKKLQNLNGPIGRSKAIHVTHNSDARPEEVMAAIYHMVQGYGQLYAEDPEMLNQKGHGGQGSNAFLYALINACGFKGKDLEEMKVRAYKKGSEEMNPDACTEEAAIYGFMKIIDGNADKYPIAAALIKASGGPGGFEKAWRTEGSENARQKGERQAGAVPNPESRLEKVIGYMKSGEYNSAVGGLKKMIGKNPSAKYRAGDFTFLVGGFTKMLSNDARQKLFGENSQYSFHANSFMRHDHLADIYLATVKIALADMGEQHLSRFEKIMKLAPYGKNDNGKGKAFAELMSEFWLDVYDKGLHDRLQGHSNWLFETARNNDTVRKYIEQLDGFQSQSLANAGAPPINGSADNEWYGQYGYAESNIFAYNKEKNTRSLSRMLNKLKFESGSIEGMKKMNDDVVGRIWKPILKSVKDTTKTGKDPEQQKLQFLSFREEILKYLSGEFSTRGKEWTKDKVEQQLSSQAYFDELSKVGIDPRALFPQIYQGVDFEAQDLEAWRDQKQSGGKSINPRPDTAKELRNVGQRTNAVLSGDKGGGSI